MTFGLWEHDPLNTVPYVAQRVCAASPEGRLVLAVLKHALFEYEKLSQRPGRKSPQLRELEQWFFANDESEEWPFSFENLCALLDLSPGWIRSQLVTLAKRLTPSPAGEDVAHDQPLRAAVA